MLSRFGSLAGRLRAGWEVESRIEKVERGVLMQNVRKIGGTRIERGVTVARLESADRAAKRARDSKGREPSACVGVERAGRHTDRKASPALPVRSRGDMRA